MEMVSVRLFDASWTTTASKAVNNGNIGCQMPEIGCRRLRAVDLRGFRKQLNKLSEPKVLGRRVTEAAFLKVLLRKCAAWDASELSRKHPGGEMLHKNKLLRDAVDQLVGTEYRNRAGKLVIKDDVEGCWKERALLCPGLDVDFLAYDMTDAELAEEDARLAEEVEMEHDIQMGEAQSDENEYSAPETEKMVLVQSPFRPLEMEM
ncbi:hypothetical protein ONS96_003627 [Cadophora gregata f. sp. sojae]|nr:hypothetical protein ONS96_003627 [Cadophora gregata f. sp. sojae]